jgi:hypothetical protein
MELATPEKCALLCALLADLNEQRSAIEARRAVLERVGLDSNDEDAKDTEQMRRPADAIVLLQRLIETLGCDCGNCKDAADGGASPGLSPY